MEVIAVSFSGPLRCYFWSASFCSAAGAHTAFCSWYLQGKEALPRSPGVARPFSVVGANSAWPGSPCATGWRPRRLWLPCPGPAGGMAQVPGPGCGTGAGSPAGALGLPLIHVSQQMPQGTLLGACIRSLLGFSFSGPLARGSGPFLFGLGPGVLVQPAAS